MLNFSRAAFLSLALLFCGFAAAATVTSGVAEIKHLYVWADYTNGAVMVTLKTGTPEECPGGYVFFTGESGSETKGNMSMLSTLLSAYHAQSKVRLYGDDKLDWSGMAVKDCRLKLVLMYPK